MAAHDALLRAAKRKKYDPNKNPWDPTLRDYGHLRGPSYPRVGGVRPTHHAAHHLLHSIGKALDSYFSAPGQRAPTDEEWGVGGKKRKG